MRVTYKFYLSSHCIIILVLSIFVITVLAGVNFVFRLRDKHNIAPWLFFITLGGAGLLSCTVFFKRKNKRMCQFLSLGMNGLQ